MMIDMKNFHSKLKDNAKDIIIFSMIIGMGIFLYQHKKEEDKKQSVAPVSIENVASVNAAKTQINAIRFNMNNRVR